MQKDSLTHCSIAVGMVLFNPDNKERLFKALHSILSQFDKVYIFDNSTKKIDFNFPIQVVYLTEHSNKGIAYALNRLMEKAHLDGYSWLITMDQDSIIPVGTLELYEDYIENDEIGIICPQVIDSRRSYMMVKQDPEKEFVDFCITSASCTRISAWEKCGKFDEWLFIDLVDNEFCKRLIVSGYKILRLNNIVLDQEFGNIIPKVKKKQVFWNKIAKILHNENFAKFGYKKYVSPMRVYYTNRNIIYVNRKLKQYGKTGYKENYNCSGYIGFLISFSIPSILRAQNKWIVTKAVVKGIYDGVKIKPEIWVMNEK